MSIAVVDAGTKTTALQRLGAAIAGRDAARSRRDQMVGDTAVGGRWSLQVEATRAERDTARETLAHSKRAMIAQALGEAPGTHGDIPVEDAELELHRAENRLTAAIEARQAVIDLIPDAESNVWGFERRVDDAADELMTEQLSPHTRGIWEWHSQKQREAAEAEQVLRHLLRNKFIGPSHIPMVAVNAFNAARKWEAAEAALRVSADTKLPPIPGLESAPPKR